jgi:hypothetical protein
LSLRPAAPGPRMGTDSHRVYVGCASQALARVRLLTATGLARTGHRPGLESPEPCRAVPTRAGVSGRDRAALHRGAVLARNDARRRECALQRAS